MFGKPKTMPSKAEALPGRGDPMPVPDTHFVNQHRLTPPFPDGLQRALFGMGCFWGAEKKFWSVPGVYSTAVGYAGGHTPNATYREVCTGMTGHNEVVLVVFDPTVVAYDDLLKVFWENHDPTGCARAMTPVPAPVGDLLLDDAQRRPRSAPATRSGSSEGVVTAPSPRNVSAPDFYCRGLPPAILAKNPDVTVGLEGQASPVLWASERTHEHGRTQSSQRAQSKIVLCGLRGLRGLCILQ
jgi:peptide-methionine (S)-S-oxide reductase